MIKSFRDKATAALFAGVLPKGIPADVAKRARAKLLMIDVARDLNDLRVPLANHLERLKDDRAGQHSIRVSGKWRLCFVWKEGEAENVEFCDYRKGREAMMAIKRDDMDAGRVSFADIRAPGAKRIAPIHPGDILRDEFLDPLGLTAYRLAKDTGMPLTRLAAILAGERAITADTALRLGRFFGMSPEFWLGLQERYDLDKARIDLGDRLKTEVKPLVAAF